MVRGSALNRGGRRKKIGLIGHGAIGSVLAKEIGRFAQLTGVYANSPVPEAIRAASVEELAEKSDLIVEAASQVALREYGPHVIDRADLFVVSVGALVDEELLKRLRSGSGRLYVTTGAIGGVDLLRAASLLGGLEEVGLTTTKSTRALIQPWMSASEATTLRVADRPRLVFEGTAREAAEKFPASLNVAATLSLVTLGFDRVMVRLIGDPSADRVEHLIEARGDAGEYEFRIRNRPLTERTSAIVPYAILRGLRDLDSHEVIGI